MALSIDFRGSVSFPPGYPSYRALTFALVGLTPTEYTSLAGHTLVALLPSVLRVVALASTHLLTVQRVHRGVGVDSDDLQLHMGRCPHPFAQDPHDGQNLPCHIPMQGIHESPKCGLYRQLTNFENAGHNRVASYEAQLIEPRKTDIQAQHDS